MIAVLVALALLGLAFGSFVNALVWRVHEQSKKKRLKNVNLSILNGRSVCPNCKHQLAWYDLVPLFSWITLKGRCRYCKKPISKQYPLVEVALALVFTASYAWWPKDIHGGEWVLFITWLLTSVGLMALLVYDARWMLLPNRILYPTFFIAFAGRLIYILGSEPHKGHALLMWALSIAVASGIFWVLFVVSQGKLIGYGDVRLGLITGTILADPAKSFLMIFWGSVLGTLFILPGFLKGKKKIDTKLPYGPFLIGATLLIVLYGTSFLDWYKRVFLS
jgi:prepilin signal peptidase PulO-like enzyme (type II secretory pathway)